MDANQTKLVPYESIAHLPKMYEGQRTVLVGGCFDIFHFGHLVFLESAKKAGDVLIILLESDEFIKTSKKREPVHNQNQRAALLSKLDFVDKIVLLPHIKGEEYGKIVSTIRPAVIAVTDGDPYIGEKEKQAEKIGGTVQIVAPKVPMLSTSQIIHYATIFSD